MAINKLIEDLRDDNVYVRLEAAETLGKLKNLQAVEYLIEVLEGDDDEERGVDWHALGDAAEVGDGTGVPALI